MDNQSTDNTKPGTWLTLCAERLAASYAARPHWSSRLCTQPVSYYERLATQHEHYVDHWTALGLDYASDLILRDLYACLAAIAGGELYAARLKAADTVAALYRTVSELEERLELQRIRRSSEATISDQEVSL